MEPIAISVKETINPPFETSCAARTKPLFIKLKTISPLLSLRRAIILTRLKKYNEALSELNFLEGTIFADKGIIMSGQIYERFYNDSSKASEFYFRIINDYPESIF